MIPVRVHPGAHLLLCIRFHDTGTKCCTGASHTGTSSLRFSGMKSDHILYRYHVKEVRGFVPVRDEWPS